MRKVAAIASGVVGALVAWAAHAETPTAGRALKATGRAALAVGLDRLTPALVGRMVGGFESGGAERTKLTTKLAELGIAGLDAAHGASFLFVAGAGLSAAGTELVGLIAKARLHAIDVTLPEAVTALATNAKPVAAPQVPAGAIEAAWGQSEGADRLDAAAKALAKQLAYQPAAADIDAQVAAEVALTQALATLVAGLPAKPRTIAVLEHPELGYYLSPDVQWRDQPAPSPTLEAMTAAFAAAREGRLGSHLEGLAPTHPQYTALVKAAERYEGICQAGPWGELAVPKAGKPDKNKQVTYTPEAITALQTRLAREGFYSGVANGAWDEATQAAVMEARRVRHLKTKTPDYDKDLVGALNVPCDERLATLIRNVKRWRYTAWTGQHEWVQVNLAGQIVRLYRDDKLVMLQRTVVGSDKSYFSKSWGRRHWRNATPILTDEIETVIVNPEWNVPGRIAREEIGPEIDKDPTYLDKHKFKVREGKDGATYYTQESGPGNALGRIKVLFPNTESVYLHDTPGKAAFNQPVRALSHGCVRVQNAVDFGAEIVRADFAKQGIPFEAQAIKDIVAGSHRQRVFDLVHKVPVFLEYYTASVDEDGAVWFHPDVYGYDLELTHPEQILEPTKR